MSKRFDWEKSLVPPKDPSGMPDMTGKSIPTPTPDREPHDVKKFRRSTKELQNKNYEKGDRK